MENWRRFFSKEPKKAPQLPIELTPAERSNFNYPLNERKKLMEADGLTEEQIRDKEERVRALQDAETLAKKLEQSQE